MTKILSTVRAGRLVRQERLEDDGRVQSWVVAGERGVAEARGARAGEIYYLVHRPALAGEFSGAHSLLVMMDAAVFPDARCTVLEGPCCVILVVRGVLVQEPWGPLEELYVTHLEGRPVSLIARLARQREPRRH